VTEQDERFQILHSSGLRMTTQRRTVLDVITEHESGLSAEDIYYAAKRLNPKISLTTVYRTLDALKKAHLVEQHYVSPEHDRSYFALAESSQNVHFHCSRCGKNFPLQAGQAVELLRQGLNEKEPGAQTRQICICIVGYCQDCSREGRHLS
jgi:Fe2+ or Zn2+ uptake regulation protein